MALVLHMSRVTGGPLPPGALCMEAWLEGFWVPFSLLELYTPVIITESDEHEC